MHQGRASSAAAGAPTAAKPVEARHWCVVSVKAIDVRWSEASDRAVIGLAAAEAEAPSCGFSIEIGAIARRSGSLAAALGSGSEIVH